MTQESDLKPAERIPKYEIIDELNGLMNKVHEATNSLELRDEIKAIIRKVKQL